MQKIFLDSFNRIDSVEWQYKNHSVVMNSHPTFWESGHRVVSDKYFVYNPADERIGDAHTLVEAKDLINEVAG